MADATEWSQLGAHDRHYNYVLDIANLQTCVYTLYIMWYHEYIYQLWMNLQMFRHTTLFARGYLINMNRQPTNIVEQSRLLRSVLYLLCISFDVRVY